MVVLIMLLGGIVEIGLLMNHYLNVMDGPREGARFATNYSPFTTSGHGDTLFYESIAREVISSVSPYQIDPAYDDVVISVISLDGKNVVGRFPTEGSLTATPGEWSWQTFCLNHPARADMFCTADHGTPSLSRISTAQVEEMIVAEEIAPNTGVVLVELYLSYQQILKLPWITAFLPERIPLRSYTIMPLPAAEPDF